MDSTPVPQPMLTGILVEAIRAANEAEGKRPQAFDTFTRHSSAAKCGRQIAFQSLDFPESEPMDDAGHWVTTEGTWIHEKFQTAVLRRYPDAEVEVRVRHGDLSSGHIDVLVTIDGITICYELKTRGA